MSLIPRGAVGVYRALRTPLVPQGKSLLRVRPEEIIARLSRAILDRMPGAARAVETLVVGCPFPEGALGLSLARSAAALAGQEGVAGVVVSSLGTSGLEACLSGVGRVLASGAASLVAGISLESRVPYGGQNLRAAISYELLQKNLYWPRHLAAHSAAEVAGLDRETLDAYAKKRLPGRVPILSGLGVEEDGPGAPLPAPGLPLWEGVPPLISERGGEPLFTVAHVAPEAEGAAALLLGREGTLPGRPLAYIRAVASAGGPGREAPAALLEACRRALRRVPLPPQDIDRVMVDESFAAIPILLSRGLGIDLSRVNLRGGSLLCGFAPGAEGIRLVGELALALAAGEGRWGLVSGWSEGGGAAALILEVA